MTQARRDLILHRPEHALAEEHGLTLEELLAIIDQHPVEVDRDNYLRRCLAQQLLLLDRLEVTFGQMAFEDRDTVAGALSDAVLLRLTLVRISGANCTPGPGRERTEDEYLRLLEAAGWKFNRARYPADRMIGIIEGRCAS